MYGGTAAATTLTGIPRAARARLRLWEVLLYLGHRNTCTKYG